MKHMKSCINCRSTRLYYAFSVNGYRLIKCADCDYLGMDAQPSDAALADIYGESYALLSEDERGSEHARKLKRATAEQYLGLIERYRGRHGGRLLEVGSGSGDFLLAAADLGYEVTGVEYSPYACERTRSLLGAEGRSFRGKSRTVSHQEASCDVCVLNDILEHARVPRALLSGVHSLLNPGGSFFIAIGLY